MKRLLRFLVAFFVGVVAVWTLRDALIVPRLVQIDIGLDMEELGKYGPSRVFLYYATAEDQVFSERQVLRHDFPDGKITILMPPRPVSARIDVGFEQTIPREASISDDSVMVRIGGRQQSQGCVRRHSNHRFVSALFPDLDYEHEKDVRLIPIACVLALVTMFSYFVMACLGTWCVPVVFILLALPFAWSEVSQVVSTVKADGSGACQARIPPADGAQYMALPIDDRSFVIEGQIMSTTTNCPADVASLLVRCWDADDNLVRVPELMYDNSLRCCIKPILADANLRWFQFNLTVPANAVRAEIATVSEKGQDVWLQKFACRARSAPLTGMNVVSIRFLLFCFGLFFLYFLSPKGLKPWILLTASIGFYLIFGIPAFVFVCLSATSIWLGGLILVRHRRKSVLWALALFNVGLLAEAKYASTFVMCICPFLDVGSSVFSIVLPLGISFYTLQAVSYCIDVYKGTIKAERSPARLVLYLTFFPTVMQGPISRYGQLGEQLWIPHRFDWDRMHSGLSLALWGFFKKMVIADRAAFLVDAVFAPNSSITGMATMLGVLCYSIQIYADFSGCVDICRGIAEVLGIDLIQNFRHPYFSTSIKDFWRRWHISLSSWLRDYVYIPLGGNRHGNFRKYLNVLIVFGVSGIWHGVGINFFIWGLLHGLYQVCDGLTSGFRERILAACRVDTKTFSFCFGQRIVTFLLVTFAWIFFRASTLSEAWSVLRRMCVWNPWTLTDGTYLKHGLDSKDLDVLLVSLAVLVVVSILQEHGSVRQMLRKQTLWFRWLIYLLGFFSVVVFGVYGPGYNASQFIYMQF